MKKNKIITAILISFLSLAAETSFARVVHHTINPKKQEVGLVSNTSSVENQNMNIVFEDNNKNEFNINEAKQIGTILNAENNHFNISIKTNNLSEKNNLENLDLGGSDLLITNSNNYGDYTKNKTLSLLDLPFLFTNTQEIQKFLNSNIYMELIQKLSIQNSSMQVIGFIPVAQDVLLSNMPMDSIQNFKNKNMGIVNGDVDTLNYYKNFLAKPILLNKDDLSKVEENHLAILEIPMTDIINNKEIKNMKFINTSSNRYDFKVVLMNKRSWNSIPVNLQQKLIETVLNDANNNLNNLSSKQNTILKDLSDNNYKIKNFSEQDINNMKKQAISIHNNYLQNINKDLLLETYQLLKN